MWALLTPRKEDQLRASRKIRSLPKQSHNRQKHKISLALLMLVEHRLQHRPPHRNKMQPTFQEIGDGCCRES